SFSSSLVERCRPSATVVCAAEGYPEAPKHGAVLSGLEEAARVEGVKLFYAGVTERDGQLVTSGGRVLSVTAIGSTISEALQRAYTAADLVQFAGKQQRSDIGKSVLSPR